MAIDLFCGLGGWTEGLLAEGYRCIGFDIEQHAYGGERYPGQLVIQDVRTLHGAQFKDAALIVASPPCQEFSYMAMPWRRAKQIARALRGQDEFPEGYTGSRTVAELTALFDACFRIQREASAAAGRKIPLLVENVRGAVPWVGAARWNFGSYYLWGDVPALMPQTLAAQKFNPDGTAHGTESWFAIANSKNRGAHKNPGFRFDGSGRSFQSESVARHVEGVKQPGIGGARNNGKGDAWFQDGAAAHGSKSPARKAASARIAKIPFALSAWIGRTYKPVEQAA
ncbi:MAG TPA: DNA cytosine methyltransferase [Caulobacterales bacterium]|nr:DNA cytosine methyltransferase [Caulobacterales bacterium]